MFLGLEDLLRIIWYCRVIKAYNRGEEVYLIGLEVCVYVCMCVWSRLVAIIIYFLKTTWMDVMCNL